MKDVILFVTGDGSHSLLNTRLGETYHSRHGAVQESGHVFIAHGLAHFGAHSRTDVVRVLEVGFGTGLNAWLALMWAEQNRTRVYYTAIEPFPVDEEVWEQLNYAHDAARDQFAGLHQAAWNKEQRVSPHFILTKIQGTIQDWQASGSGSDVVFYDAFAPGKQPEMWDIAVLRKVTGQMLEGALLVTYCARGQFKRDLKSLGLTVETLPGPPGKKEMVRASKKLSGF